MDIKREVKHLVVYAKCQEAAEVKGDKEAFAYHGQRMRQSLDDIDRWADMAEAAIAHAEYQIRVHSYAPVDSATYIRERGQLWDAYMAAREKTKEVSNEST